MREFLKGLELDDELVDTIMAEHGKHLTKLKEQNEEYKTKIEKYDTQIAELNNTIESKSKDLENYQNVTNENRDRKAKIKISDRNVNKELTKFIKSKEL